MIQIGLAKVLEPTEMVNSNFECAAWYERLLVPAGEYPINTAKFNKRIINGVERECIDWYNSISYTGTVLSDDFGARFCGVPLSNYDNQKNTGKQTEYHPHMYDYILADKVLYCPDAFALLDGYEVVQWDTISSIDGSEIHMATIAKTLF